MKKILFVKIESPGYSSQGMVDGWKELGFEVIEFNWQEWRFNWGIPSTRQKMIDLALENKPDLIFLHIQNKEILDVETAQTLRSISPTINFTFDVRDSIEWYKKVAPYITHTFFACQNDVDECFNDDIENVSLLQSSDNFSWYKKLPLPYEPGHPEIVFIGNNFLNTNTKFPFAKERQDMVQFLYENFPGRFEAYGRDQKGGEVNHQKAISIYNRAKIGISQNLFSKTLYTSDRLWRIMGCGTFCLTKRFDGIKSLFKKEIHLDWFDSFDEMKSLIDFYLSDDMERSSVAAMGSILVRESHRWRDRWKKCLEVSGIIL